MTTRHPDYAVLAARIAISNLHKETKKLFSQVIEDLYTYGSSATRARNLHPLSHYSLLVYSLLVCVLFSQSNQWPTLFYDITRDLRSSSG
jgi:hypothetical protein